MDDDTEYQASDRDDDEASADEPAEALADEAAADDDEASADEAAADEPDEAPVDEGVSPTRWWPIRQMGARASPTGGSG